MNPITWTSAFPSKRRGHPIRGNDMIVDHTSCSSIVGSWRWRLFCTWVMPERKIMVRYYSELDRQRKCDLCREWWQPGPIAFLGRATILEDNLSLFSRGNKKVYYFKNWRGLATKRSSCRVGSWMSRFCESAVRCRVFDELFRVCSAWNQGLVIFRSSIQIMIG